MTGLLCLFFPDSLACFKRFLHSVVTGSSGMHCFGVNRFSFNPAGFRQDIPIINRIILCQHFYSQIALLTNTVKNSAQRHCQSNTLENKVCLGRRITGFSERVNPDTMGFVSTMMQLIVRVFIVFIRSGNCKIRQHQNKALNTLLCFEI